MSESDTTHGTEHPPQINEARHKSQELLQGRKDKLQADLLRLIKTKDFAKLGAVADQIQRIERQVQARTAAEAAADTFTSGARGYQSRMEAAQASTGTATNTLSTTASPLEQLGQRMQAANIPNENIPQTVDQRTPSNNPWETFGDTLRGTGADEDALPATELDYLNDNAAPEGPTNSEILTASTEKLRTSEAVLNNAILLFARQKEQSESLRSSLGRRGADQGRFNEAKIALDASFGHYASSLAEYYAADLLPVRDQLRGISSELATLTAAALPTDPGELATHNARIAHLQLERDSAESLFRAYNEQITAQTNAAMMAIRERVDAAQLEIKRQDHPWLSRAGDVLRNKPGLRAAIGGALLVTGVAATAVGFAPGMAMAAAGKVAMRGIGGYLAGESGGGFFARRRAGRTTESLTAAQASPDFDPTRGVRDLTSSMQAEADTRRRGKKAGVGLGILSNAAAEAVQYARTGGGVSSTAQMNSAPNTAPSASSANLANMAPENQEAFSRYLGVTSAYPEASNNFNAMFNLTPDQIAQLKAGKAPLDSLITSEFTQNNGLITQTAKNQFNFELGKLVADPSRMNNFSSELQQIITNSRGAI